MLFVVAFTHTLHTSLHTEDFGVKFVSTQKIILSGAGKSCFVLYSETDSTTVAERKFDSAHHQECNIKENTYDLR